MLVESSAPPTSRPLGEYFDCETGLVEATLARQTAVESGERRRRLGEWLLEDNVITIGALYEALRRQRIDRLAACRLFVSLDESTLASVSEIFQEVSVPMGDTFIHEDDAGNSMYVLASGRCEVYRGRNLPREVSLAHILPGEPIGELGYFAGGSRTASVRAVDDCQLLRARYEDLSALFEENPGVAAAFMEIVTERLRDTNLLYQRNEFELDSKSAVPIGPALRLRRASRTDQLKNGIERLLRRTVRSASRITDAERATLYVVDEQNHLLVTMSAAGGGARQPRMPLARDIRGWVVQCNRLANVAAMALDEALEPSVLAQADEIGSPPAIGDRDVRSVVCAPVRGSAGRVVGLLEVVNKRAGTFDEMDEVMMRSLAAQASVCIENIDSFQTVRNDFERATDLLELATVTLQAPDIGNLLCWLQPTLERLLHCERVEFLLFESAERTLWTYTASGDAATATGDATDAVSQPPVNKVIYPLGATLSGEALMAGKPLRWTNVREDHRFDPSFDDVTGIRTSSMLSVPVSDRARSTIGVLQALNAQRGSFSARDEAFLSQVAELLGLAQVANPQ